MVPFFWAGGEGGADFQIGHLCCRIGLGLIILVSESAGELPELVQNMLVLRQRAKKKEKKKKRARVASFLTRAIIALTVILAGKKSFIYTQKKKKETNICSWGIFIFILKFFSVLYFIY